MIFKKLKKFKKIAIIAIAVFAGIIFSANDAQALSLRSSATNQGLVGYWSFNEGSGLKAMDYSGNNNTGTLTGGPTWTNGKAGQALSFDGSDDYVQVSDASSLRIANIVTISAWIKLDTYYVNGALIAQKRNLTTHAVSYNYGLWVLNGGALRFEFYDSAYRAFDSNAGELVFGQWINVVAVSDEIADTVKLYKNGVLIKDLANTYAMPSTGDAPVQIGCYTYTGGSPQNYPLDGLIDEVRIYNRALGASEVEGLYKLGATKFSPPNNQGLVGYWSFNEGSGLKAMDYSGNNNTGTLTGASHVPTWTNGKAGKALSFDGSDDYVSIKAGEFIANDANSSMSAWIKWNGTTGERSIYDESNITGTTFRIQKDSNNYIQFGLCKTTCDTWYTTNNTTAIVANTWYFITSTFSSTAGMKIYVNGVEKGLNVNTTPNTSTIVNSWIGRYGQAGFNFPGLIDEVRIYNRALSASEIAALYRVSATKFSPPNNQGLVGYWSFNEGSGLKAMDYSGNNNTGTLTGPSHVPTWTNGKAGKALSFDGSDDYVLINDSSSLKPGNGSWSVSVWAKPAAINQATTMASKGSGSSPYPQWSIEICGNAGCFTQGKKLEAEFVQTSTGNYRIAASTFDVADGNWHQFAMVADKNADIIKLYMDGAQLSVSNSNGGTWPNITNTDPARIGAFDPTVGGWQMYFNGLIDEVRIYNRALGATEIQQLYSAGH